jgi:hypothetical protein
MRLLCRLAFMLLLVPVMSVAADHPPAPAIKDIEGVYKSRFTNGLVSGERYQSEDIVEIASIDESRVYIRAHLEFYNGHICSIWGVAEYRNGDFVYQAPEDVGDEDPSCTLKLSITQKNLLLSDIDGNTGRATCRMFCGARGSLSNYSIDRNSRRKIRYIETLRSSRQYLDAIEENKKLHREPNVSSAPSK